jgi:peptide/nickel transport system substrate-binding protein
MKKGKFQILCAGILGISVLLAACGGGSKAQPAASAGLNRPFVYVAQQVVGSVDPAKVVDETEVISAINLYDPLYYPDMANKSMAPVPHLATGHTVSADGTTYDISLRQNVTFQSGNPLSADDVIYSIQRMLAIKLGYSWLWNNVLNSENITKVDDHTVRFKLNYAYAPFIASLTQLYVVDSVLLKGKEVNNDYAQGYLENNSAGSGPYILKSYDRNAQVEFTAYDKYWKGWKDNQFKDVQMKIITEEATVKTLLVSGQADMVHQWLPVSAYKELESNNGVLVDRQPSAKLQEIHMNNQKAPTDDIYVRQAISTAFDYDSLLENVLGGCQRAEGAVPVIVPGHSKGVTVYKRDLNKAKEYIARSKYSGDQLKVTFMYLGDYSEQRQYAQLLQFNLQEIGVPVELIPSTWAQIVEACLSPAASPNLSLISDSLKYPHVDSPTYGIYHPSAAGSYRSASWYRNDEVTKLLESARQAIDVDQQMALYEKSQDIVTAEAASLYVANPTHHVAFRDYVEGYTFVGLMGYDISFYYLSLKK